MRSISIRPGVPSDIASILELIVELAVYEKAPNEVIATPEQMLKDGFGENPAFGFFVAEMDGQIVGTAIYYVRYSTWKGRVLYLEDIVVKEALRGRGVGKLLFEQMLRKTKEDGYYSLNWQVLDWNEPAIRFYDKFNAEYSSEWLNGRITAENIDLD